jgi:hypothetical protein
MFCWNFSSDIAKANLLNCVILSVTSWSTTMTNLLKAKLSKIILKLCGSLKKFWQLSELKEAATNSSSSKQLKIQP